MLCAINTLLRSVESLPLSPSCPRPVTRPPLPHTPNPIPHQIQIRSKRAASKQAWLPAAQAPS